MQVIVHNPHGLHKGVHGGGADKAEAQFFEGFAQRQRFVGLAQGNRNFWGDFFWTFLGRGFVRPHQFGQCAGAVGVDQLANALGVVDG